jgi:hypothetical protein
MYQICNPALIKFRCDILTPIEEVKKRYDTDELNQIMSKWENLGFLEGLEGEDRVICGIAFEQMSFYMLLSKNREAYDKMLETLIFPVIRMVISKYKLGEKYNTATVVNAIRGVNIGEIHDIILFLNRITDVDPETEICHLLAEKLSDILNGKIEVSELYDSMIRSI